MASQNLFNAGLGGGRAVGGCARRGKEPHRDGPPAKKDVLQAGGGRGKREWRRGQIKPAANSYFSGVGRKLRD